MSQVISAKNLGAFAVPGACPRCLWVQLHVSRLPYQIFPGIFSTIDSYNKKVVHAYFDREGAMPEWLAEVGDVVGYVPPPSYQRFSIHDAPTDVTLRGTADGIFQLRGGGHAIVDYKTAKFTPGQEAMRPIYETQLNAYAYIGDRVGLAPVSRLALIYMEPVTDDDTASEPSIVSDQGFALELSATVVSVDLQPESMIPPLLQRVRTIADLAASPAPRRGCRDCEAVTGLISAFS